MSRRRAQLGQSMIEYAVVAAVLVFALFFVHVDDRSVAQLLADSVRAFFRNMTYFLSLP